MKKLNSKALDYHAFPQPGKLSVSSSKKCDTAEDLSLAYTPGVAEPVLEIVKDPKNAYRFTNNGNYKRYCSIGTW
jgi:malate dehydrogenase (oxaloacetate-decarboxylating)(NADP+)